jgi:hypothetical protein
MLKRLFIPLTAFVLLTACQGGQARPAQCRELGAALSEGGREAVAKAKGKTDDDPALAPILDDYVTRINAAKITDAKLVSERAEMAKALQDQAAATRAWQAATTPTAKATYSAAITAARADQDRVGRELMAACS